MCEVGRTRDKHRKPWRKSEVVSSLSRVLPTSQVFTSGYVNTQTILHFFYKITNERGMKTVFTYAHVKWFLWPIRARILFELFYNNPLNSIVNMYWVGLVITTWGLNQTGVLHMQWTLCILFKRIVFIK